MKTKIIFFISCIFFLVSFHLIFAQEYTSSNFKILDPVIFSGGYSTSTNYRLTDSVFQIIIGTSTATNFGVSAGFLYFPYVSTPVVTATPGNGQVSLSWTASQGFLGWTVSGYNVGQSLSSGGPYTYGSSLGNVLSTNQTGLTNGTPYYFVIRVEDAFGNSIATSTEVSATPTAPSIYCGDSICNGTENCSTCPSDCGVCGGGGGGPIMPLTASANFSGRAYPKSTVTLLKDAQVSATSIAASDANFMISLTGVTAGNYNFSIYSEDKDGRRSSLLTFPVTLTGGATTNITGIFIAPTIAVDKTEVKRGNDIAIFGQSTPQADIIISVNSEEEYFSRTISDKNGVYLYNFDTSVLDYGSHSTKSKASIANQLVSGYSYSVNFKVGTRDILAGPPKKCPAKADLNNDCRVNLVDFSIAAYWYKRTLSESFKAIEKEKLNGDGKVTLVDFSIMAYYWTG